METGKTGIGISMDQLPQSIRNSVIISPNDLRLLATVPKLPMVDPAFDDDNLKQIIQYYSINPDEMERELHVYAKTLLSQNKVQEAWQVLLAIEVI